MAHENAVTIGEFNDLKDDISRLNTTVYTGNGEPGLVSRMTAAERSLETLAKVGWVAITAMFTTAGLVIADLVVRHVK